MLHLRSTLNIIFSCMAGRLFKVGHFAHTLCVCLMREHLRVNVNTKYQKDLMASDVETGEDEGKAWYPGGMPKMHQESASKVAQHKPVGSSEVLSRDAAGQGVH